jgi:hypothetical protein
MLHLKIDGAACGPVSPIRMHSPSVFRTVILTGVDPIERVIPIDQCHAKYYHEAVLWQLNRLHRFRIVETKFVVIEIEILVGLPECPVLCSDKIVSVVHRSRVMGLEHLYHLDG